jgi:anti-sigma B factor antagonist
MELNVSRENNFAVLTLAGRMDAQAANEAEIICNELMEKGEKRILFDMPDLEYISSAGLRVLLSVAKKLKNTEGSVKISGVKNYVKEVFDITGFTPIFDLYATREEAVKNFE